MVALDRRPDPMADAADAAPTFTVTLVRPSNQVHLRYEFLDLELVDNELAATGDDAEPAIRVVLGSQHTAEEALARYQPESFPGAHLSSIVRSEPARLGPTRLVTLDRQDDGAAVTVIGGDAGNVMTVTVQQANPDIADPDLRWEDLLAPVELTRQPLATGARWEGTLVLPVGDSELRLLIADGEPAMRQVDGMAEAVHNTVYVETVVMPTGWVS